MSDLIPHRNPYIILSEEDKLRDQVARQHAEVERMSSEVHSSNEERRRLRRELNMLYGLLREVFSIPDTVAIKDYASHIREQMKNRRSAPRIGL